ncbi:MAG: Intermediate filament protein [Piccolia ochrophora]|nr:MAG: Intermediate filament protein [Piccolia ochrophora]
MALTRRDIFLATVAILIATALAAHLYPLIRYIVWAFVGGGVFAVATIGILVVSTSRRPHHPPRIHHGSKSAAFVAPQAWSAARASLMDKSGPKRDPLYPPSFVISDILDDLLDLLLRDFVMAWYGSISRSPSFPNEVNKAIRDALGIVRERILAMDLVEVGVTRMVPLFTAHLKDFQEAEAAIRGKDLERSVTESEELDLAIAGKYRDGRLHPAASLSFSDTKLVQQEHLRRLSESLIPEVMTESQTRSRSVVVMVREIVACAILYPAMQLLSDPDIWNQIMDAYGRTLLQDRKSVRKLRDALDAHASPPAKAKRAFAFPKLAPGDNERRFEKFIRAIRLCKNVSDARRFRSEVSSQLKREVRVPGQDPVYMRRLETGKRFLDQRVAQFAGNGDSDGRVSQPRFTKSGSSSRIENANMKDILHDLSGLSYFMEFMDRQHLMDLVQFWLVVEGLRSPLEEDLADEDDPSTASVAWTAADRSDIAQINEAYLSKAELKASDLSQELVKAFLKAGNSASSQQYLKARQAILRTQTKILEEMQERHLPKFKDSDLFYKYLASKEASGAKPNLDSQINAKPLPQSPTQSFLPRPMPLSRPVSSRLMPKAPEMKRSASSTGILKATSSATSDSDVPSRRSLEGRPSTPLFDDDDTVDPLSNSVRSLDATSNHGDGADGPDDKVVEAMEAALNNILEDESTAEEAKDPIFDSPDPSIVSHLEDDSRRSSLDAPSTYMNGQRQGERPSIASLGLVNTSSRIGVFSDEDLFPDEEKFIEDEHEDTDEKADEKSIEDEIHEAAPGDLGLSEAISALTADIDRLTAQDTVVDSLTMKAELTNNTAELRILRKSKASLEREIRRKELQRQQYIVQESDSSLYGRATVKIKNVLRGMESDGREYALYLVEVQRKGGDQMPAATWAVPRRYSEFHDLHQRLRGRYPSVRSLDFPRRRVVMKLQKDFVQKRRMALERYLRELLLLPDVCRSRELRAFLSQQAIASSGASLSPDASSSENRDLISRFYNSVTDGVDDLLGNIPALDQLSLAGQTLLSAATSQLAASSTSTTETPTQSSTTSTDPTTAAEAEAELRAFDSTITPTRDVDTNIPTSFITPICTAFLELFSLAPHSSSASTTNWLRGRAVVVVLHQLLGGTIERKVRDVAKTLAAEDAVLRYLGWIRSVVWEDGPPSGSQGGGRGPKRREWTPRTRQQKERTRRDAGVLLASLVPEMAGSVVGRANAKMAGRKLFAAVNNGRLNTHLAFTLLDEFIDVLFPGVVVVPRNLGPR